MIKLIMQLSNYEYIAGEPEQILGFRNGPSDINMLILMILIEILKGFI